MTINYEEFGLTDHKSDSLFGKLLTKVGTDMSKLSGRDKTIAITIEDLEGLNELLLKLGCLNLAGHEGDEFGEITVPLSCNFYPTLVTNDLYIILSEFMTKGIHEGGEVLGVFD